MMNPLRKTLFAAATAGSLWLSVAATSAFAAPTPYQATGPILEMTDTTITIQFHGKEKWTFARDASTTGADALKVGDRITVHYTMTAGVIEPAKGAAPAADTKAKPGAKAKASPTASQTTEQKPAAEPGVAASPAATPGH